MNRKILNCNNKLRSTLPPFAHQNYMSWAAAIQFHVKTRIEAVLQPFSFVNTNKIEKCLILYSITIQIRKRAKAGSNSLYSFFAICIDHKQFIILLQCSKYRFGTWTCKMKNNFYMSIIISKSLSCKQQITTCTWTLYLLT